MKKILFIISFIAATSSTIAQSGYYHQVGDTVRGKCPIYHYENGWWPTLNATGHTDSLIGTIGTFGYMKHTTNTPLKVIGIASTWARLDRTTMQEDLDDSTDGSLYYVLLDATASGPVELTRVCWTDDYSTHPTRYMELPRRGGESCDIMQDYTAIVPLREYYFDSAITVTDSFYLGCVIPDPTVTDFNDFSYIASHIWDYCSYSSMDANGTYKECATDMPEFIYYDSSRLDTAWRHHTYKRFQLVFPIIEVDTFCITPEEPQVADRDSLRVRVEWTDASNLSWEVSRTTPGGDPDTGLITPTTNPYIEYTDIDNNSVYNVYVRGYCETGIWSGWSDWSTPCLIDSIPTPPTPPDPPVGITHIETADFMLSPNPTDGTVQILGLQDELTDIDVLDMTGRLLKTFEKASTFNISTLPSGIYIVRVKTHCDNTDKVTYLKLVKK